MSEHKRFRGSGHWVDQLPEQHPGIESDAKRFFTDDFVGILLDESRLKLECSFRGKHYTAQLSRDANAIFRGEFLAHDDVSTWSGQVAGRLFHGANGILFHGTWATDSGGGRRTFWTDLQREPSSEISPAEASRFVDCGTEFVTVVPSPES